MNVKKKNVPKVKKERRKQTAYQKKAWEMLKREEKQCQERQNSQTGPQQRVTERCKKRLEPVLYNICKHIKEGNRQGNNRKICYNFWRGQFS